MVFVELICQERVLTAGNCSRDVRQGIAIYREAAIMAVCATAMVD